MSRTYQARANGIVLSAVIIAGLASLAVVGNYTYFGFTSATAELRRDGLLILACGVVGGAAGAFFSSGMIALTRRIRRLKSGTPLRRSLAIALAAGLVVALLGVASDGMTFGTGYAQARSAIEGTPLPPPSSSPSSWRAWPPPSPAFPAVVRAFALGRGRAGQHDRAASRLADRAGGGARHGRLFLRRRAGADDGLRHHPGDDRQPRQRHRPDDAASVLGYGTARLISREPLYHALSRLFIADVLRLRRQHPPAAGAAAAGPA